MVVWWKRVLFSTVGLVSGILLSLFIFLLATFLFHFHPPLHNVGKIDGMVVAFYVFFTFIQLIPGWILALPFIVKFGNKFSKCFFFTLLGYSLVPIYDISSTAYSLYSLDHKIHLIFESVEYGYFAIILLAALISTAVYRLMIERTTKVQLAKPNK